ncbi:hypothetical protein ZIOFF_000729 [Zingiber officinale]|uniref:Uncharacterized protein n=1 Tax=Zingiber officinale TaxID=94328 RepID=A0A8J5HTZ4_ZINOF|nr:hypothetical protein ZIOFF_000729 [Zingiber officinale]
MWRCLTSIGRWGVNGSTNVDSGKWRRRAGLTRRESVDIGEIGRGPDGRHCDVKGPQTVAFNLPNDERIVNERGTSMVLLKNVSEAKYDANLQFKHILLPIADVCIKADQKEFIDFESFYTHTICHECCHGIGPHTITLPNGDKSTVRLELQELHSALEEAKADIVGLWALKFLINQVSGYLAVVLAYELLPKSLSKSIYVSFLAGCFRSTRFGLKEAHGKGQALQFNWLYEKGAFLMHLDGTFSVDFGKVEEAVESLSKEILTIQARGDKVAAMSFLENYAKMSQPLATALEKLEKIQIQTRSPTTAAEPVHQLTTQLPREWSRSVVIVIVQLRRPRGRYDIRVAGDRAGLQLMDTCKVEPLGAKAQTKATRTEDNPRPSHEKNDTIPSNAKPRTVASRYMNGISSTPVSASGASRRCSSPIASQSRTNRVPGVSMSKRSHSADRRRSRTPSSKSSALSSPSRPSTPSTPSSKPTTPVRAVVTEYHKATRQLLSNKAPDGLWPSIRSLSSSLQSESLTVPVNKREKLAAKSSTVKSINLPSNVVSERKRTPLRGMNTSDQSENSKPAENSNTKVVDRHRWPSMMGGKLSTSAMLRSMDLSDKISRSAGRVASQVIFPNKIDLTSSSASGHPKLSLSNEVEQLSNNGSGSIEQNVKPVVNLSSQPPMKSSSVTRPTSTQSSFILGQQRPSSPSTQSSIIPGLLRPSTPSKVLSSSSFTSRAMLSPLRTRASTPISLSSTIFGTLGGTSFASKSSTDGKIGKLHASDIEDAHQLKLLYNASLQWCFVNAQTNKTLSIQKMRTENVLQSVWNNISTMGNSVLMKRIDVQHLHQEMKLGVILKGQVRHYSFNSLLLPFQILLFFGFFAFFYPTNGISTLVPKDYFTYNMMSLEQWAALGEEHCSSLFGAIEALNTSILRLPVMGGTKAAVIDMRNAVSSAIDMMHAINSSICLLLSKVKFITTYPK